MANSSYQHAPIIRQFGRFLGAGGVATGTHWITMAALIQFGVQPLAATMSGNLTGALINFALQSRWTFGVNTTAFNASSYSAVCVAAWVSNALAFSVLHGVWDIPSMPAQLITSAMIALQNFILFRNWVFQKE